MDKAEKRRIYDELIRRGAKPSEALYQIERAEREERQAGKKPTERISRPQPEIVIKKPVGFSGRLSQFILGTPEEREHKQKVKKTYQEEKRRLEIAGAKRRARAEEKERQRRYKEQLRMKPGRRQQPSPLSPGASSGILRSKLGKSMLF